MTSGTLRVVLVSALSFLALLAGSHTVFSIQTEQEKPPVFRSEVIFVEVDAVVTDDKGEFIADLSPEDFILLEDGELQEISSFRFVDLPSQQRDDTPPPAVMADVVTNERSGQARIYALVLDDLHTAPERTGTTRELARRFIEEWIQPDDFVSVTSTGGALQLNMTQNRHSLLAAVDTFTGQKLRSATLQQIEMEEDLPAREMAELRAVSQDHEQGFTARRALEHLRTVGRNLGSIEGRRKAIVFISEGIDYDIRDVFESSYSGVVTDEARATVGVANHANVSIYSMDPRGLGAGQEGLVDIRNAPDSFTGKPATPASSNPMNREIRGVRGDPNLGTTSMLDETRLAQDSLTSLSDQTGGFAIVRQNDLDDGMRRIVDANSRYYLLGYYPNRTEKDGRFRRIEVRVKRRGSRVEARKGYVPSPEKPAVSPGVVAPELLSLVASPVPSEGIGLRAFAAPIDLSREQATVPVVVDVDVADFRFAEEEGELGDRVEVYVEAHNRRGIAAGSRHNALDLVLRPDDHARMLEDGLRYLTLLTLPPGAYRLRIGVYEHGAGLGGSVVSEIHVPEPAGQFRMSRLLVSSRLDSTVPVASRKEDRDRLPLLPSPQRTFGSCDELSTYAEMGGIVSYPVEVETSVRDPEGKISFRSSDRYETPSAVRSTIDLSQFQVGSYVLEVRAQTDDDRRAERQLSFQITGPCDAASSRLGTPSLEAAILHHAEVLIFSGRGLEKDVEAVHFETIERLLDRLPESQGDIERDLRLLLACFYHSLDLERSKDLLEKAEHRFPEDARVQLALGVTEEVDGWARGEKLKLSGAAKRYRKALEMDPDIAEAHLRLGRIYRNDRQDEDAEHEWRWVIEHTIDGRLLYLSNIFLGDLRKEAARWDEAVDAYRAAVAAGPEWQLARLSLSQALHATGQWQEARDVAVEAVELPVSEPDYLDAYRLYYVGLLHWVPDLLEELRREVAP